MSEYKWHCLETSALKQWKILANVSVQGQDIECVPT